MVSGRGNPRLERADRIAWRSPITSLKRQRRKQFPSLALQACDAVVRSLLAPVVVVVVEPVAVAIVGVRVAVITPVPAVVAAVVAAVGARVAAGVAVGHPAAVGGAHVAAGT